MEDPSVDKELDELMRKAGEGDQHAMDALFHRFRGPLKSMIRVRLNRRLQGRVDDSDILQDALLDASRRIRDYLQQPQAPFFLWLRRIAADKLLEVHRTHLGTQRRDASREVSIHRGSVPYANSVSLAAQLVGRLTSPSISLIKAELRVKLQEGLAALSPLDREILSLRHFEHLSNNEAALELGLEPSATSKRYIRALASLRKVLRDLGVTEGIPFGES